MSTSILGNNLIKRLRYSHLRLGFATAKPRQTTTDQQPVTFYDEPDIGQSAPQGHIYHGHEAGKSSEAYFDEKLQAYRVYHSGNEKLLMRMKWFSLISFTGYQTVIPSAAYYAAYSYEGNSASNFQIFTAGGVAWLFTTISTYVFLKYSSRYVLEMYLKPNRKAREASIKLATESGSSSYSQVSSLASLPDWLLPHPEDSVIIKTPAFFPKKEVHEIPLSEFKLSLDVPLSVYKWVKRDIPKAPALKYFMINKTKVHSLPLQPLHEYLLTDLRRKPFEQTPLTALPESSSEAGDSK